MAEPLCRRCRAKGLVTIATVPDHIKPLAKGGTDDDTNIQCLCEPCHAEKTAEDFGHRAPKQQIGADGWPVSGW